MNRYSEGIGLGEAVHNVAAATDSLANYIAGETERLERREQALEQQLQVLGAELEHTRIAMRALASAGDKIQEGFRVVSERAEKEVSPPLVKRT